MNIALAGNQNSGKTTLFNRLTGSNQRVGNWPGVTVDKKEGTVRKHGDINLVDLPGIYSLSPYSMEEVVSRDYLTGPDVDGIINIVDATNIERNLYLTLQLCEIGKPMVIALNMMDEVRSRGDIFYISSLQRELGIPIIPISARSGEGCDALVRALVHTVKEKQAPPINDICDGPLHEALHAVVHLVEHKAVKRGLPRRYVATKLIEGDGPMQEQLGLDVHEKHIIDEIAEMMEHKMNLERDAALADARYNFIGGLISRHVRRREAAGAMTLSNKIDRVLTNRILAIPCFLAILMAVFWLTFGPVGSSVSGGFSKLIGMGVGAVDSWLGSAGAAPWLRSLIVDGALAGIGSMLGFLPVIVLLFFFLSVLEDTGYMARAAFVVDRLLGRFGLSGRAFFPMMMGFGCTVPAIMAARGMSNRKERRLAVVITPFMSCAARIPIYGLFIAAFFETHGTLVMMSMYLLGTAVALVCAFFLKDAPLFRAGSIPFVMELPPYRLPSPRTVLRLLADKAGDFVKRAFTVIFAATVVIWLLSSFSPALKMLESPGGSPAVTDGTDGSGDPDESREKSMLEHIGTAISPLFAPIGFGTWEASTSLLTGLVAKEAVVSTMAVLYRVDKDALPGILSEKAGFTPVSAFAFMAFTLLYMPCVAAFAAMKRELGGLLGAAAAAFQTGVAWTVAFVIFQAGRLFTGG